MRVTVGRPQAAQVSPGRIRFSRRHVALLEQLRQFPNAAHDDGPDALEMAVDTASSPEIGFSIVSMSPRGENGGDVEYNSATGRSFEWHRINSYDDLFRLGEDIDRNTWRFPLP